MSLRIAGFLMAVSASLPAAAAIHVWRGEASNRFSDHRNWDGGSPAGDPEAELVFPEALRQSIVNDLNGLTVKSMTFDTDGYVLRGNAITLLESANVEARQNDIGLALRFEDRPIDVPLTGHATFTRDTRIATNGTPNSAPRSDAQSQVLTIGDTWLSARVTPSAETAWIGVMRQSTDYGSTRRQLGAVRGDTDRDGVVRWTLPPIGGSIPESSKWAVVDESSGKIHAARGNGEHIEPGPLNVRFLRDQAGNYSMADITWPRVSPYDGPPTYAVLWVRPGVGAWRDGGGGGGGSYRVDVGPSAMRAIIPLTRFISLEGSDRTTPGGAEPGDILVAMSMRDYASDGVLFGGRVDDALATATTIAAEVGLTAFDVQERLSKESSFVIARYGSTERPVTVSYRTHDRSAVAGVHYEAVSGTVTLGRGEQSRRIFVPLIDDDTYSGSPHIAIELTAVTAGTFIGPTSKVVSIRDDDPFPVVAVTSRSVAEGGDGLRHVDVELTLTGKTRVATEVEWQSYDGQSDPGSGKVVFAPGENRKTISVAYLGNTEPERNRTIFVDLTHSFVVTVQDGTVEIIDDDAVGIAGQDVTVNEAAGTAEVSVVLSAPLDAPLSVKYLASRGGQFVSADDFGSVSGTLIFAAGETLKRVTVPIHQDKVPEDDEVVILGLTTASHSATVRRDGSVTIQDDSDRLQLTLTGATVEEGFSAMLEFAANVAPEKRVRFVGRTVAGTATAGRDYREAIHYSSHYNFTELVLEPRWRGSVLYVDTIGDRTLEQDETLTVEMFESADPTKVVASATIVIQDSNTLLPGLSVSNSTVGEGSPASFDVVLSTPAASAVSFRVTAVGDGAEPGLDFEALSTVYTLEAGEVRVTVKVPTIDDGVIEGDEMFALELSHVSSNARIADGIGRGVILDDDYGTVPTLTVTNVTVVESAGIARFTVELTAPAPARMAYSFGTANGTALAGEDYVAVDGALLFEAGETTRTVDVRIVNDGVVEPDETFTILLSNGVQPVCTIVNDDAKPAGRTRAVRH